MDPLLAKLQRAVAGRYTVEHELGRGGMAVVFLGHDLRLNRRVAIKVVEDGGSLIAAVERFLGEIRIAAQLQHPNILPVFEAGDGEDLVYYVMPYIAGGSLQERLEREGPLPVGDAIRIAREVAEALDHAHRAGIVHRDIKPANIMLADGVAVVADFGIARALEAGGGRLTATGLALGTPAYMSPEQATASTNVDGRADVYALGCVLYEMLAGTPPFSGPTGQAVMARHATDQVPPLRTIRAVPPAIEAAVFKALAKVPGDRWPTARAMADALASSGSTPIGRWSLMTRVAAAVALLVVTMAAGLFVRAKTSSRPGAMAAADSLPSIAVLPFEMIGDSSHAYIASGLTEAVITAFVRVGGLRVPEQATVSQYAGRDSPVEIGRELRVDNVLTGVVQVNGAQLRVMPRLVRVSDGTLRWSETYDGEMANVFAMQDMIMRRIIDTLRVQLTPRGQSVLARGVGTKNQEAYALYMLGRSMYGRADPMSLRRSAEYFKQAAAMDSSFAAPLLALADTYDLLENVEPGRYRIIGAGSDDLVRRASALDPGNGDARLYLAKIKWRACSDAAAESDFRQAFVLSPGSPELRRTFSIFLSGIDRLDEALTAAQDAARLDPVSPWTLAQLAWAYSQVGKHDSAVAIAARMFALDSTQWVPRAVYGGALALGGRVAEGIVQLEAARRLGGDAHGQTTGILGWAYGKAGRRRDADSLARLLGDRVGRGEAARWHVAYVYAGLGDTEKAFEWLAQPARPTDARAADYGFFQPMLTPLRTDPRFQSLAGRRSCAPKA